MYAKLRKCTISIFLKKSPLTIYQYFLYWSYRCVFYAIDIITEITKHIGHNNVLRFQRQPLGCFRTLSLIPTTIRKILSWVIIQHKYVHESVAKELKPRCCRGSNPSGGRKFEKKSSLKGWERESCVALSPREELMLGVRVKKGPSPA